MTRTTPSTDLPVPEDALYELGLTDDDIALARESAPLVCANQLSEAPGARFDVARVQKVLSALGVFKHTKGRWAGRRLRLGEGLDAWQVVWILAPVFGWVRFDPEAQRDVRVATTAWVEVPRKNGKSTISSAIANVLLLADGEPGAEVYAAAGSKPQAGRVYEDAKRMALTASAARRRVEPLADVMRVPSTGSFLRVLSRIAETAHGLNVHGGVIDEVHTLRLRRKLVEAIETGTGARDQPLIVFITTADEAEDGTIYDEKHGFVVKIANRTVTGEAAWSTFGVIWAAEDGDDVLDEATWLKANPGLRAGSSPTMAYMRKEAAKADATPSYRPTFSQLHLNLRSRSTTRWLDLATWDRNAGLIDESKLKRRQAWVGLDLAAVSDFSAAWVGVDSPQPGKQLEWLWRFWIPEERIEVLSRQLQIPLRRWVDDGWVTATEGDVVDYGVVEEQLVADCKTFDVQRLSYDRMFAGQLMQNVEQRAGVDVVPVNQTYLGLSPACKEIERGLKSGDWVHGGNPVARWMASVVEVRRDQNDNVKPVKPDREKSATRIDGIQALATGMDGWVRRPVKRRYGAYTAS